MLRKRSGNRHFENNDLTYTLKHLEQIMGYFIIWYESEIRILCHDKINIAPTISTIIILYLSNTIHTEWMITDFTQSNQFFLFIANITVTYYIIMNNNRVYIT